MKIKKRLDGTHFMALLVIILFVNLPVVSALELSNIFAEDITESSAVIKWKTDEPADSFLSYGENKKSLETIGDANLLTEHQFLLTDLTPETLYYY